MRKRAILHIALLAWGLATAQSLSTLAFVLPVWIISFFAAIRNDSKYFDFIDLFWLLNQLAFVNAPLVVFSETGAYDNFFLNGVSVPFPYMSLTYPQSTLLELFLGIYIATYVNYLILPHTINYQDGFRFNIRWPFAVLAIALSLAFTVEVYFKGGITNILRPRYDKDTSFSLSSHVVFQNITLATALVFALRVKLLRGSKRIFGLTLLFSILLTLYNPLNAARFNLVQVYLPITLIFFPRLLRFHILATIIFFGMAILMPILSTSTRFGLNSDFSDLDLSATKFIEYFDQISYMLHLTQMALDRGLEYGQSTLAVVFFFVPRDIWENKALSIALVIGNDLFPRQVVGTNNLAAPIISDFYLDFGLAGVFIGSIGIAWLTRMALKFGALVNGVPVMALYFMAILPILVRGSIQAVAGVTLIPIPILMIIIFLQSRETTEPEQKSKWIDVMKT